MAIRRTVETVESSELAGASTSGEVVGGSRLGARLAEALYTITSLLVLLLLARFTLLLLGANAGNGFVNFIYTTSYPFVAPFFGILNHAYAFGVQGFEFESLIAIAVVSVAGWGIAQLASLL